MTEYALYGVLHWHRQMGEYAAQQARGEWKMHKAIHPSERTVGVMGLGVFGADIASKLAALGYNVCGWSRTGKPWEASRPSQARRKSTAFSARAKSWSTSCRSPRNSRHPRCQALRCHARKGRLIHLGRGGHLNEADLVAASLRASSILRCSTYFRPSLCPRVARLVPPARVCDASRRLSAGERPCRTPRH